MSGLTAACGLALLAIVFTLTLKKDSPAIAFLLALMAGLAILYRSFASVSSVAGRFEQTFTQGGMSGSLYLPVIKAVGVAAVIRVMSALCKDAGQSALAAKLEIAGAVLAISMCLPLFEQVLALVTDWAL